MKYSWILTLAGAVAALLLPLQVQGAAPQPPPTLPPVTLEINGDTLHGSQLTAGKTVWVLGLTRDVVQYQPRMGHVEVTQLVAADGTFSLKMKTPAPVVSLWLMVDMATGRYTIASPTGFVPRHVDYYGNALKSNGLGEINQVETYLPVADIVVIRPGEGVWTMTAIDGGPDDDDHKADSRTRFVSESMKRVGDSPAPPKKIAKGDVVFILDPRELTHFEIEVGR